MSKTLIERQLEFMKTTITIKVIREKQSTIETNNLINEAFDEFDKVVKKFTRFNEDSELANLNRQSGKWVKVSDEFFWLIEYMLDLAYKTDGVFDPTVIDFLEMYGYDKNYNFAKSDDKFIFDRIKNRAKIRPSFKEIELDKKEKKVKLATDQRLDLGGVGKGYAVDLAYDVLSRKFDNFLIDAGGDLRAKGKNLKEEWWKVELKALQDGAPKVVGVVELKDEAVASSGNWSRRYKFFHHLINTKTGEPQKTEHNTVFVQAKTCMEADSWATIIFLDKSKTKINKNINYLFF